MTEYTKWAFDGGLTKVDYLKGEETYKFEFVNGAIQLNGYIQAVTYRGYLSLALHRLWQSGRRLMASHQMPEDPELGAAYSTKAGNIQSTPPRAAASQVDETII